jgi:hypothetical protein
MTTQNKRRAGRKEGKVSTMQRKQEEKETHRCFSWAGGVVGVARRHNSRRSGGGMSKGKGGGS